jgi:hypothetical protein
VRGYDGAMDDRRTRSLLVGIVVLVIGLWYFADRTLGLNLPRLNWDQLWPLILVAVGI